MEAQLEQIRDQQKDSWNVFSQGWKKWDDVTTDFLKPMSDEIIRILNPKEFDFVLDVAAGTGEPGLTIATMLGNGKVILTDIADRMLDVAREKAALRGINNYEAKACDVCELPFEDNSFDSISCRFGFMFFPDMLMAAKEMVRVLKPGGKIATSVWNSSEKNFWVTAIGGTISRNLQLPAPPPKSPGMFRCAESGMVADLFRQAGLKNVFEKEIFGTLNSGTTDAYWDMMTDLSAPIVSELSKADEKLREKIKRDVFELINKSFPDGKVIFNSSALVISGEK